MVTIYFNVLSNCAIIKDFSRKAQILTENTHFLMRFIIRENFCIQMYKLMFREKMDIMYGSGVSKE